MVQITESTKPGSYILNTEKGKEIEVCFSMGAVWVRVIGASARIGGVSMGRRFASLGHAVEHYKNADVKMALRALISELI